MNDGHCDVLRYVTAEDTRALLRAYRQADAAAQALTAALRAAHVHPRETSVMAVVGGDGRPLVVVTLTRDAARLVLARYGPPASPSRKAA